MEQVYLSFVLPAYNEEDNIIQSISSLTNVIKNLELPYEIIIVNDGSKDATLQKALDYAKKDCHVKVISYCRNMGKGYAIRTGFMQAKGEAIFFGDSDSEIDFRTITYYLKKFQYADIVIASKWHPQSNIKAPLTRKLLSHSFNAFVRILTGSSLKDTQVGLKFMRKSAFSRIIPRLAVKRYAFDVELLVVAHQYNLRIVEMPVNINLEANFKIIEIWRMFIDLLGIAYRLRIRQWYQRKEVSKDALQSLISTFTADKGSTLSVDVHCTFEEDKIV